VSIEGYPAISDRDEAPTSCSVYQHANPCASTQTKFGEATCADSVDAGAA